MRLLVTLPIFLYPLGRLHGYHLMLKERYQNYYTIYCTQCMPIFSVTSEHIILYLSYLLIILWSNIFVCVSWWHSAVHTVIPKDDRERRNAQERSNNKFTHKSVPCCLYCFIKPDTSLKYIKTTIIRLEKTDLLEYVAVFSSDQPRRTPRTPPCII